MINGKGIGPVFDQFSLSERGSADQTSPIEYVRGLLNKRFRVFLIDGKRQIIGIFVGIDRTKALTLKNSIEVAEDHEREVGVALIPLVHVSCMEVVE
jgi:small nuclear ribonucleoprotein (snRNP)-like protein